jgi:hypothetical protein
MHASARDTDIAADHSGAHEALYLDSALTRSVDAIAHHECTVYLINVYWTALLIASPSVTRQL